MLKLPKKHPVGLYILCTGCKMEPKNGKCAMPEEKGRQCRFQKKHRYRIRLHIPGTKNKKFDITINTRDYFEAASIATEKYALLKNGGLNDITASGGEGTQGNPENIQQWMAKYIDEIHPDGIVDTSVRKVTHETADDYSKHLSVLQNILQSKGIYLSAMAPQDFSYEHARSTVQQLRKMENAKGEIFSAYTVKKYKATYEAFFAYLKKYHFPQLTNHFQGGWNIDLPEPDKEIIYEHEFMALLKAIDTLPQSERDEKGKIRRYWYPWLKDGFRQALFSGIRLKEVAYAMHSDYEFFDEKKQNGVLKVYDRKASKISGKRKKIIKTIEINDELRAFMLSPEHSEKLGTDAFVVGDDFEGTREHVAAVLSRSFTYYVKSLGLDKELTFQSLRVTYATTWGSRVPMEKIQEKTRHGSLPVIRKYYYNEFEAMKMRAMNKNKNGLQK